MSSKSGPMMRFFVRWFVSSLGLLVASAILGGVSHGTGFIVILIAGLLLALVNAVIKPIIVILSLPAILFSLGLFMIVINGFMVVIVSWLYPNLQITGFGSAMLAGLVIGLVNYLVSTILEEK